MGIEDPQARYLNLPGEFSDTILALSTESYIQNTHGAFLRMSQHRWEISLIFPQCVKILYIKM
jgi:hypothetical protein